MTFAGQNSDTSSSEDECEKVLAQAVHDEMREPRKSKNLEEKKAERRTEGDKIDLSKRISTSGSDRAESDGSEDDQTGKSGILKVGEDDYVIAEPEIIDNG